MSQPGFFNSQPKKKEEEVKPKATEKPVVKKQGKVTQQVQDFQKMVAPKGGDRLAVTPALPGQNPVTPKPQGRIVPMRRDEYERVKKTGRTDQIQNPFITKDQIVSGAKKNNVIEIIEPVTRKSISVPWGVNDPTEEDAVNLLNDYYAELDKKQRDELSFSLFDFQKAMMNARPGDPESFILRTKNDGAIPLNRAVKDVAKLFGFKDPRKLNDPKSREWSLLKQYVRGSDSTLSTLNAKDSLEEALPTFGTTGVGPLNIQVPNEGLRTMVEENPGLATENGLTTGLRNAFWWLNNPATTMRQLGGKSRADMTPGELATEELINVVPGLVGGVATGGASTSASLLSRTGAFAARAALLDAPGLGIMVSDAGGVLPAVKMLGEQVVAPFRYDGKEKTPDMLIGSAMASLMILGVGHGIRKATGKGIDFARTTGITPAEIKATLQRGAAVARSEVTGVDSAFINDLADRIQKEATAGEAHAVLKDPLIAKDAAVIQYYSAQKDFLEGRAAEPAEVRLGRDRLAFANELQPEAVMPNPMPDIERRRGGRPTEVSVDPRTAALPEPIATVLPEVAQPARPSIERRKGRGRPVEASIDPRRKVAPEPVLEVAQPAVKVPVSETNAQPDASYHYTDGNLGMTANGSFTKDKSRWIRFTREDAERMQGSGVRPYGATRTALFTNTDSNAVLKPQPAPRVEVKTPPRKTPVVEPSPVAPKLGGRKVEPVKPEAAKINLSTLSFDDAKKLAGELDDAVSQAGKRVSGMSGGEGPFNMTPDSVKSSPEWKKARDEYAAANSKLREFNSWYTKKFKREIAKDRELRRTAPVKPSPAEAVAKEQVPAKKEPWEMTRADIWNKFNEVPNSQYRYDAIDAKTADVTTTAGGLKIVSKPNKGGGLTYYFTDGTKYKEIGHSLDIAKQNSAKTMADVAADIERRPYVQKALAEGKPVPPEVLADYPDLKVSPSKVSPSKEVKPAPEPVAGKVVGEKKVDRYGFTKEQADSIKKQFEPIVKRIDDATELVLNSRGKPTGKLTKEDIRSALGGKVVKDDIRDTVRRIMMDDDPSPIVIKTGTENGQITFRDPYDALDFLKKIEGGVYRTRKAADLPKAARIKDLNFTYDSQKLAENDASKGRPATTLADRTISPGEKLPAGFDNITGPSGKTISAKDFKKIKPAKGEGPLFQATPSNPARGTYQWNEAVKRGTISFRSGTDASTVMHEFAHHFLQTLKAEEQAKIASIILGKKVDAKKAQAIFSAARGGAKTDYTRIQEAFATGYEANILAGRVNPELQDEYDRYQQYMQDVYGASQPKVSTNPAAQGALSQARKQTDTPEFKKWFGDSKVVDEKGEPLVIWRGEGGNYDATEFQVFDRSKVRDGGIFMSPEKSMADLYGDPHPYFIKASNILDLRDPYNKDEAAWISKWAKESGYDDEGWIDSRTGEDITPHDLLDNGTLWEYENGYNPERWRDLMLTAEADGYDAVRAWDTGNGKQEAFVVFDPKQIKSAIGNKGTFDPNDPSILNQMNEKPISQSAELDAYFEQMMGGPAKRKENAPESAVKPNKVSEKTESAKETYADRFTHQNKLSDEGAATANKILGEMEYNADTVRAYKVRVNALVEAGANTDHWKAQGLTYDEVGALRVAADTASVKMAELEAKLEDKSLSEDARIAAEDEIAALDVFTTEAWGKIADQTTAAGRTLRFAQEVGLQNFDTATIFRKAERINGGPLPEGRKTRLRKAVADGKKALETTAKEAEKKATEAARIKSPKPPKGIITKEDSSSARARLKESGILNQSSLETLTTENLKDLSTIATDKLLEEMAGGNAVSIGKDSFNAMLDDALGDHGLAPPAREKVRILALRRFDQIVMRGTDFGDDFWKSGQFGLDGDAGVMNARAAIAAEFADMHKATGMESVRATVRTLRLMSLKNRLFDVTSNTINLFVETAMSPLNAAFDAILFPNLRKSQGKASTAGAFMDVMRSIKAGRKEWMGEIRKQMAVGDPQLMSKYGIKAEAPGVLKYVGRFTGVSDVPFRDVIERAVGAELDRIAPNLTPESRAVIIANEALEMTFSNDNVLASALKAMEGAVERSTGKGTRHGIGLLFDLFVPFPKVLANVAGRVSDYGFGATKASAKVMRAKIEGSLTIKERRAINRLMSRNLVGLAVYGLFSMLAKKGYGEKPEEVNTQVGYLKWKYEDADQAGSPLLAYWRGLSGLEYIRNAPDLTEAQRVKLRNNTMFDMFAGSPIMGGLKDVGGLLANQRKPSKIAGQKLANALIPAGVRNTAKLMDNPKPKTAMEALEMYMGKTRDREASSFADQFQSRTPKLREKLPLKK